MWQPFSHVDVVACVRLEVSHGWGAAIALAIRACGSVNRALREGETDSFG